MYNQDLPQPHAVLATLVDFSKAFNRVNHNTIITILSRMGIPGWLLKIISSYLSERELILRYKGKIAGSQKMPGGGPQGSILGCFLFLILINSLGLNRSQSIGKHIAQPVRKRNAMMTNYSKFIDDLTIAVSINLKQCLSESENGPRPLNYHARTGHVLTRDKNPMQDEIDEMVKYASEHEMVVNEDKTKVILFNARRSYDFQPHMILNSDEPLEVVEEIKLLGIVIRSNLCWSSNTNNMCKKAFSRMWIIRRLKALGADHEELVDIYRQQILSVLELAVPVWAPGLTQQQIHQLERVQKTVIRVILSDEYTSHKEGLRSLKLSTLTERRQKLCKKFTSKAMKHDKFNSWFASNPPKNKNTRSTQTKFKEVKTRTKRYRQLPIPYLTNIANSLPENI